MFLDARFQNSVQEMMEGQLISQVWLMSQPVAARLRAETVEQCLLELPQ